MSYPATAPQRRLRTMATRPASGERQANHREQAGAEVSDHLLDATDADAGGAAIAHGAVRPQAGTEVGTGAENDRGGAKAPLA